MRVIISFALLLFLSFSINIKIASNRKMNDQELMEFVLQGETKIKEMRKIQPHTYYHQYYTYFEIGEDPTLMIDKKEGWYYPDIQKHIKELKEKWTINEIPLEILIENRRIKILHKSPSTKGDLA